MVLKILGGIIALLGAFMLFDARRLVKKYFDFGEENNATLGMKVVGFIIIVVGRHINDFAHLGTTLFVRNRTKRIVPKCAKTAKIEKSIGEKNNEFIKQNI